MRKTGQTAKLHEADILKSGTIAKYGDYLPQMIDTLESLELVCKSKSPAKEIREAMADKPKVPRYNDRKYNEKIARQSIIRRSLIDLLCAIDDRDARFFSDMAKFFKTPNAHREILAADPLRARLSDIALNQKYLGAKPVTLGKLQAHLKVPRQTVERAAKQVGLKISRSKVGRPVKSLN